MPRGQAVVRAREKARGKVGVKVREQDKNKEKARGRDKEKERGRAKGRGKEKAKVRGRGKQGSPVAEEAQRLTHFPHPAVPARLGTHADQVSQVRRQAWTIRFTYRGNDWKPAAQN